MKTAFFVAILLLLSAIEGFADSQQQIPSAGEKIKHPYAQAESNNSPSSHLNTRTECLTAVNKFLNSQKLEITSNDNTSQHKEEPTHKWWETPDIWVAVFTGILAVITGALAYFTLMLWRSTKDMASEASVTSKRQAIETQAALDISRQAADAAKISAEAAELTAQSAIGAELPRFIVTGMVLRQASPSPYVTITLTNHGRTEAVITGECAIFRKEPFLPPNPRYPLNSQKSIDFGKTIKSGESHQIGIAISQENITNPGDGNNFFIVWVFGFIRYRDFLNKNHIYGFVGGASLPSTTKGVITAIDGIHFQQQGPSAYTYSKYAENDE